MSFKINQQEQDALRGLPYLQRLVYILALRPYMDYATGVVGIFRGISHQSIREDLYVDPHPGYQSGSPSKDKVRRALKGLEKNGLINVKSTQKKLIVGCLLADKHFSAHKKAAIKPPHQAARNETALNAYSNSVSEIPRSHQAAIPNKAKAATPLVSGNNNTLSLRRYEKSFISEDFQPSATVLAKARELQCPTVDNCDELIKFISYHQSKGTQCCDWSAEFLGWLLQAKRFEKEKNDANKSHQLPGKNAPQRYVKRSTQSAIEQVKCAYEGSLNSFGEVYDHHET